jgi:small subunit ribosomal protein S3
MGQKSSPTGFRTGITLNWQSTWYSPKNNYGEFLVEDYKIRDYVDKKFNQQPPYTAISKVEIARTRNEVKVTLHTARPGMVIGPRGAEVDKLREQLEQLVVGRSVNVSVVEVKEPSLDARLLADLITAQLRKRAAFRRVMKQQCEAAMTAGAKGVKIICSGRLGGSEMARKEIQKLGSIPLQTLDANVDYAVSAAKTTYGTVGVKVWIYKGKFGEEIQPTGRPRRGRPRRRAPRAGGPYAGPKPDRGPTSERKKSQANGQAAADKTGSSGTAEKSPDTSAGKAEGSQPKKTEE